MKNKRVNSYLIGVVLTLALLPLLASYLLIDEVLKSAIALAIKPGTEQLLQDYRSDLKQLKTLDPANQQQYKTRFVQAGDELLIYQQPQMLQQVLRDTYLTYYLVLFVVVLLLALFAAVWLSRKVARSYNKLVIHDLKQAQKIQQLTHFEQWQAVAGKLAHEINNPLTPINMMVSNLSRVYTRASSEVFQQNLADTQAVVSEEVYKLKQMVSHFSRFAKLPEPVFKACIIRDYCSSFIRQHQHAWPAVQLTIETDNTLNDAEAALDQLLFNQCLINIINNAVQANPMPGPDYALFNS